MIKFKLNFHLVGLGFGDHVKGGRLTEGNAGISGALAKGDIYKPSKEGVLVYFATDSIEQTLNVATAHGARVLYPVTDNGIGLVAEFEDTEGNRIALYQDKPDQ